MEDNSKQVALMTVEILKKFMSTAKDMLNEMYTQFDTRLSELEHIVQFHSGEEDDEEAFKTPDRESGRLS
jgi:hypothetical protein